MGLNNMRFYYVQLSNGLYSIIDLKAKWKIMDDNGTQLYTSFGRGYGFTLERAIKEVDTLNKAK